jgi:hypothetical protein
MKGEELLRLQADDPSGGAPNQTLPSFLFLFFFFFFCCCCSPPSFFIFFFLLLLISLLLTNMCVNVCGMFLAFFSGCVCVYVSNM